MDVPNYRNVPIKWNMPIAVISNVQREWFATVPLKVSTQCSQIIFEIASIFFAPMISRDLQALAMV